ncbi:5-dehydro-2-deoxygluconokinase [Evansella caseinilytica]|uniref:5-dehydro-2-deoxygluconokinase n=1 Tax=Evansella caseinilytica TaxID=1503961 RepID=A0A1H3SUU6_9BACI|nr:5-dehydro-2-deoxygluconokinase [Evansella caseinilytica]SDZ41752.1 5-dehydro-2-deoxygluconokinase [Evansella caseinilytica]
MAITFNNDRPLDIIAIGRACLDLNAVEYNRPLEETMTFRKYVGGSPANIVIGGAKLGLKTGFIGKVSADQHGRFIREYMTNAGVDTSSIVFDNEGRKSGLAFTEIISPEECSILMYRENVADLYLTADEVNADDIKQTKMLLVSGTALAQSPSREAVFKAIQAASAHDVKVVFELDYRPYTWKSDMETAVYYHQVAEKADVVIGTREEFNKMENVEEGTNEESVRRLFRYSPQLIVIKHGVDGSYAYERNGTVHHGKAYKTKVLKTFGAGDSYASAFLYALLQEKTVEQALHYGGASAAIVVSKHSSSEAMPTEEEIIELMANGETHG